ncbi:MAG: TonB-dependent receptor [Gammaproteobacteria bacterium]|nr:TonB-dependent receptor [Gammaproteobacteria bacterium]
MKEGMASLLFTSVLVCAVESPSSAQETGQKRGDADNQLQEIVVTAEKRTGRIQDIPISVTALSGAELQAEGISNAADAAREIPGVAVTDAGPGQTEYTIRGLSSSGPAVATVGFYLDDAPMTAPSNAQNGHVSIDPNLYDLNRVEVLRGPQGTLYGSGSMGGTVKLVTNQPDLNVFSVSAKADGSRTTGGGDNGDINAMLNIPIIDGKLALRLVGTDERNSGWIDRVVVPNLGLPTNPQCAPFAGCTRGTVSSPISKDYRNVNDEHLKGGRAALRYQATDQFSVTASAFYQTISQDGLSYYDNPPGNQQVHYQPFDIAEPFSDTFRLYNLVADYAFPGFTVTSATSYWTRSQLQMQDSSESIQTTFDFPAYDIAAGGVGPVSVTEIDTTKQFSEEVRLASAGDTTLKWLIGGFYSNYTYGQVQSYAGDGILPVFGTPNLVLLQITNKMKQKAAFGEASYKIVDGLKATLGLRYYSYNQDGATTESGALAPTLYPKTTEVAAQNSGLNPKFTLSYDVVRDVMVYATAAKGFRPGAGNAPAPVSGPDSCLGNLQALGKTQAPTQYGPDTVWSYELGEKATLFDKRVTINSAVYYERWSKVQQLIVLGCGFGYTDNVGTASIRGGEVEINAKLSPSWMLTQSGGYTHAVLTSTEAGTGVAAGSQLPHVPTYTTSTSLTYNQPLTDKYTMVARASNVLTGPSEVQTYSLNTLPSYDIVRARVGVLSDGWSAFLFVDNLTNKQAALDNVPNYFLNIPSLNRVATNQPRTIGLSFEIHR